MRTLATLTLVVCGLVLPVCEAAEPLPFGFKTSTYCDVDGKVTVDIVD